MQEHVTPLQRYKKLINLLVHNVFLRPFLRFGFVIMVASYNGNAHAGYKSAGERVVANGLRQLGLPFSYEYPWAVLVQGKPRIFYPDFTLMGYGVVIEYVGMQGCQDYDRIMARKERIYEAACVPVIVLQPDDLGDGWPESLLSRLESICQERQSSLEGVASPSLRNMRQGTDAPTRSPSAVDAVVRECQQPHGRERAVANNAGAMRVP